MPKGFRKDGTKLGFQKGYKQTIEHRKKRSLALIGRIGTMKGKKFSKSHRKNMSLAQSGKRHWNWQNGIRKGKYISIYQPYHPLCNSKKLVAEHRLITEKHLNRFLDKKECIHHIDGNRTNNKIENLFVFENINTHMIFHHFLKSNLFLKTFLKSNLI
jgi:hypothetical protein